MSDRPVERPASGEPERIGVIVVHGVGEARPGEIGDALVEHFEDERRAAEFRFLKHSEVHPTTDPISSKGQLFPAFLRRTGGGGPRSLWITELYWADLSRVGRGPLSYAFAMLMLFFEAPVVLVESMQKGNRSIIHRLVRRLLRIATWLMRWPIAGLTIALFYSGFVFVALRLLGVPQSFTSANVEVILIVSLPFLVAGGVAVAWKNVHKNIGLTDLGLSTAISGTAFLAFVLLRPVVMDNPSLQGLDLVQGTPWLKELLTPSGVTMSPLTYFLHIFPALGIAWAAWWTSVLLAIVLLLLLEIWRLIWPWRRPVRRRLVRAWAAVGIVIAQEIVWRIIVDPLTILTLIGLDPCIRSKEVGCAGPTPRELYKSLDAVLLYESENFIHCLIGLVLVAGAIALAHGVRTVMARLRRPDLAGWRQWMPRLIASPLLIVALVAALLIQFFESRVMRQVIGLDAEPLLGAATLGRYLGTGTNIQDPAQLLLTTTGLAMLFVFLLVLRQIGKAMHRALHIARELIDHQYTPNFGLAEYLLPRAKLEERYTGFPRRRRILARLERLVADIIAREHFDRLVLLGHSQGTVIIHDYLRTAAASQDLANVSEVHVVTLGSPLTHLYQHYFYDYARADRIAPLPPMVKSWTNLWRCDDPIGNGVAVAGSCPLQNVELDRGGHTDYWREDDVVGVLLEVIRGNPFCLDGVSPAPQPGAPDQPAPGQSPLSTG